MFLNHLLPDHSSWELHTSYGRRMSSRFKSIFLFWWCVIEIGVVVIEIGVVVVEIGGVVIEIGVVYN